LFELTIGFTTLEELERAVEALTNLPGFNSTPLPIPTPQDPVPIVSEQDPVPIVSEQDPVPIVSEQDPVQPGIMQKVIVQKEQQQQALLDKSNIPWDARIHTSTKGQTKHGIWKRKPRIEDEFFNAIVEELSSGKLNHSQLLQKMFDAVATSKVSVCTIGDALNALGLKTLDDASGKPEIIESLAKTLGLSDE
jgi:hypothetical protein